MRVIAIPLPLNAFRRSFSGNAVRILVTNARQRCSCRAHRTYEQGNNRRRSQWQRSAIIINLIRALNARWTRQMRLAIEMRMRALSLHISRFRYAVTQIRMCTVISAKSTRLRAGSRCQWCCSLPRANLVTKRAQIDGSPKRLGSEFI